MFSVFGKKPVDAISLPDVPLVVQKSPERLKYG